MVFAAIGRFAREHPFKFGCVFSCAKTSFSDWLVQTQVEKREHIDWRRNGTFASFGFFYLGGVQYALYVPIFSRMFPGAATFAAAPMAAKLKDSAGIRNMLLQVGLDQFVHHPLMYFPAFYCLKEVVNGGTLGGGIQKYQKNYKEDLVALWKIWIPSSIINFSLMPMHLRIPWVASTSLIWTCIISYMRGDSAMETDPEVAMDVSGGNQGRSLRALYDLGIAAKPAYMYSKDKVHYILTATGRDRIGFISMLAGSVAQHNGNVLDVKAYKVGREFVTILLVEVDPTNADSMQLAVKKACGSDIKLAVQASQPWHSDNNEPRCKDGVTYTGLLRATGHDQTGILAKVTTLLEELKLDIASVECRQHVQYQAHPDGNQASEEKMTQVFQIFGVVRAFSPINRKALEQRLIDFEAESADHSIRVGITETESDPSFSAFNTPHSRRGMGIRQLSSR